MEEGTNERNNAIKAAPAMLAGPIRPCQLCQTKPKQPFAWNSQSLDQQTSTKLTVQRSVQQQAYHNRGFIQLAAINRGQFSTASDWLFHRVLEFGSAAPATHLLNRRVSFPTAPVTPVRYPCTNHPPFS